ncbi:hypothetical protein [Actinokineospora enzanensis]|uniref:hypothetical protein n=1 Tax=Actinokineospora enzanensis TaxID=155975 RepID=UPI000365BBA4|nr:hypothetical protein [Actinokineospora enzanensis]
MSVSDNEIARMMFADLRDHVDGRLGAEEWLTLYRFDPMDAKTSMTYFCALAQPDYLSQTFADADWDLLVGDGGPGYESYGNGDTFRFIRIGDKPVEPFVHCRSFPGAAASYIELSEEFRLFHNLCVDSRSGRHFLFDEAGDEIDVARVSPDLVQVRLRYIKEYLAARDLCLLIFFEYTRTSESSPQELGVEGEGRWTVVTDDYMYNQFLLPPWTYISAYASAKSIGCLRGKKVVRASAPRPDRKPWDRDQRYEEFIIGTDEDGHEKLFTCDEENLSNYFGKNAGAPHFLTPVFFRRNVLGKYYNEARRYTVSDSYVSCASSWGLRIDNNHPTYVTVFLGDLGNLPHKEQVYWKSFNVVPDGKISATYFGRSILGQWLEPEAPDLLFKSRYEQFGQKWHDEFGWYFFKPLKAADAHYFDTLHLPEDGNQAEFDSQVMALAKVLIERINEKEIKKYIEVEEREAGISKLEKYLAVRDFLASGERLPLLRNLQDLRSGPAHVKGEKYERALVYFRVEELGYNSAFGEILTAAIELLRSLSTHFGIDDENPEDLSDLKESLT